MQEFNLKDIQLTQAGLTYDLPFYNTLRKYNINTVYQLLYDDTMNTIIKNAHEKTRNQLLGFIDLVKFRYLGTTLPMYTLLDIKPKKLKTLQGKELLTYQCDFTRMGFNGRQKYEIIKSIQILFENNLINENTKLIDCFKEILLVDFGIFEQKTQNTCELMKVYIETYNNLKNTDTINDYENKESDFVRILEERLNKLISQRDKIDIEINNIRLSLKLLKENENETKFKKL